jgi:hypothetical protein
VNKWAASCPGEPEGESRDGENGAAHPLGKGTMRTIVAFFMLGLPFLLGFVHVDGWAIAVVGVAACAGACYLFSESEPPDHAARAEPCDHATLDRPARRPNLELGTRNSEPRILPFRRG